jgi:mono/diheme cytochrome c family protein
MAMRFFTALALLVVVACACSHTKSKSASIPAGSAPAASESVRTIQVPRYQATLPDAPNRDVFAVACLTCHTPRYITMQPPMSAAKWEESVRKMAKTYGAPIAEEQVPKIVKYLVMTKEGSSGTSWDALAVASKPLWRKVEPPTNADAEARGAAIFARACASCHGTRGAGDGITAHTMVPRPTDLTSGVYQFDAIVHAIDNGVPGTAMPATPNLSDVDMAALAAYTQKLGRSAASANAAALASTMPSEFVEVLYMRNCSSCHGQSGRGDGLFMQIVPRLPANFHVHQLRPDAALRIISDGVPGTTMPQWRTKLTDDERRALAAYVRGFYGVGAP